jgi:lambda repressor-like predicted transcriptional regulator
MHPADIKAALEKAGSNQVKVARSVRGRAGRAVTGAAVRQVITGHSKSRAIASRISTVTGIPVSQLWPGKYPDLELMQRSAALRQAGTGNLNATAVAAAGARSRARKGVRP